MDVFVFGSNLNGHHGRGAALEAATNWDAQYGLGVGPQGRSYAIPTKGRDMRPLELADIGDFVHLFIKYAEDNPQHNFIVTRIGCGLAGYDPEDIAPMFIDAPENCQLPDSFIAEIEVYNQD